MSSLYQNSEICIHLLLTIIFGVTQPPLPLKWLCLLVRKHDDSKQKGLS